MDPLAKLQNLVGHNLDWPQAISLSKRETALGYYLKLHGTLNWRHCPRTGCPNSTRCHNISADIDAVAQHIDPNTPCRICGSHLRMAIVPPTFTKDYERMPGIALMWRLAAQELRRARKVIIVGVSLAPSDARLGWLLQYGLNDRPGLVNIDLVYLGEPGRDDEGYQPHTVLEDRLTDLVPFADVSFYPNGFEPYLIEKGIIDDTGLDAR